MDINEKADKIVKLFNLPGENVLAVRDSGLKFPEGEIRFLAGRIVAAEIAIALESFNAITEKRYGCYFVMLDAKTINDGSLYVLEESGVADKIKSILENQITTGRILADRGKFGLRPDCGNGIIPSL